MTLLGSWMEQSHWTSVLSELLGHVLTCKDPSEYPKALNPHTHIGTADGLP